MPGEGSGRKRRSASGGDAAGASPMPGPAAPAKRPPRRSNAGPSGPAQAPDAAEERLAVVGVDIGHHGTGWGYAWKSDFEPDENIRAFTLTGKSLTVSKEPTCILLDENDQFVAFGDDARDRAHAPGQDLSKIKFFENFKMKLKGMTSSEPTAVPDIGTDKSPVLVRILLQVILSVVFKAAWKRLRETPGPTVRVVAWVITYPIIWTLSAQKQIRMAAEAALEAAGMPAEEARKSVELLPEPDAAALWVTRNKSADLYSRDMVVDNGGGTNDITCFQKVPLKPNTRALAAASKQPYGVDHFLIGKGEAYGAKFVDNEFEKQVLMPLFEEQYELISPQTKHEVIKQFQDIKHEYSPLERDHRSTLRLHSVLFEFRDKVDPAVLQARIQQKGLRLEFVDPGYLKLQPELIEDLFRPVSSKIVDIIVDNVKKAEEQQKLPHGIILAGGFSQSEFLQHEIREAVDPKRLFPDKPEYHGKDYNHIMVTEDCILAVLKGAVLYGKLKDSVQFTRKARFTWGHDFDQKLAELRQEFPRYSAPGLDRDIAQKLEKHLFTHEGEEWVDERFQAIVRKDDIVSQNQKVKGKEFVCLKNGTNSFNIYESIDPDPHFTSDNGIRKLGEVELQAQKNDIISMEMCFGGDEITVTAYNKTRKSREIATFRHAFEDKFDEDSA